MKRIIKSRIFYFILGAIIFGTLGTMAATQIASSNVTYSKSGTNITVESALNDLFNKTKLQVGNYVYMTPSSSSYSIAASDTGYTSVQTINPSELNRWIIISKNSDGTYDAVSEYISSKDIYFNGQAGFQKFVGTLNTIANQYQNSTYTTKARHMGYSDQTETITDTSKITSTIVPWTESTPTFPAATVSETTKESQGFGDIGYLKDYYLVKEIVGTVAANKIGTTTASSYWLASRFYVYRSSTVWSFNTRYGRGFGDVISNSMCNSDSSKFGTGPYYNAIRPIITLKSGIKVTGGSGTSADPYTIGV